ncbi:hypothetical protein JTE90_028769 [Oedothorax gibbosus]|uniref:Peptidase S1 domain-containing protein n=1 Tax=Oedothorax gibbosus TaxID=931172 RepID=A0AAV6VZI4_9ARAC|nr:hypothetical protein JTE90_028769 [Oedothorax gibbosus]
MKFYLQYVLFSCIIWLCVQDIVSCFLYKSRRTARQARYPPSPKLCCTLAEDEVHAISPEYKLNTRSSSYVTTQYPPKLVQANASVSLPSILYSNETRKGARRSGKTPFPAECGRSQVPFRRIVGGQESVIGAWPWMAIIYYVRRRGTSAECGGVLITKKHVLTAAHCIVSSRRGTTMRPRQLRVRLGDYDLTTDADGATPVDVEIESVIKYKGFDLRTFQNDVAILLLKTEVVFDKHVFPICLPFDAFIGEDLANRNAFAAGWGTVSYGGPASPKLQEVQLRIWENPRCEVVFKKDVPITQANLCAGDGDKDACRGDSGGPLMLASSDGRFYLIGIVSFGKKCAEPGIPGVYTRVTNFIDWIESNVETTM